MLSAPQQQAVQITEQPLLIVAGPGSGKTFTLTERIVNIILTFYFRTKKGTYANNCF